MSTRRDSRQVVLNELQRVAGLLKEEVIPRLHGEPPGGNGGGHGNGSHQRPHDEWPPDRNEQEPVPRALRGALESLYQELSSESAAALGELFTAVESTPGAGDARQSKKELLRL